MTHLQTAEKKFLLSLARDVITQKVEAKDFRSPAFYSGSLQEKAGVFVTLHKKKVLRGCIGYVEDLYPLQKAVEELALAAAFEDPRFPPVQASELADLDIEISVLSPLKTVKNIEEIQTGRDGLLVEKNYCRGLLLPQVATVQKWDRETFLNQTCLKAGLPVSAWKDKDTIIKIFSAEIFAEHELAHAS